MGMPGEKYDISAMVEYFLQTLVFIQIGIACIPVWIVFEQWCVALNDVPVCICVIL